MNLTIQHPAALGSAIRKTRQSLGLTQPNLALSAGVGVRFLVELENGKPTAQIGKIMQVLTVLGIKLELSSPSEITDGRS